VVAALAVYRAAHRVDQQAGRHRLRLDARVQLVARVEGLLRAAVLDQLDADEQPAAADVAHMRMRTQPLAQRALELRAALAHVREQLVALNHLLHRERGGRSRRVADVGVAVLEQPAAAAHRIDQLARCEHRADRLVAAAQPFGERHQVRDDAFLFDGVQAAGAPHAAHHFVGDVEDAVAVAQRAHALQVAAGRRDGAGGRADDGLGHERDHLVRADALEGRVQLGQQPVGVVVLGFGRDAVAILVARRDVAHVDQQRRELAAAPLVAADRERAQRVAVVALAPRDEVGALLLADLDEVLARELQRRFDRLGTAGNEIDLVQPLRRMRDEVLGQRLGHVRREEAGVGVGELVDLLVHRSQHVGMRMAQAGDGGAAAGVEVTLAVGIDDVHALRRDCPRRHVRELPMDDAAHL